MVTLFYANCHREHAHHKRYFHVTTRYRADLIIARGIDPAKATGKRQVAWVVSGEKLDWAIAHCSIRHNVLVEHLRVFELWSDPTHFVRSRWQGVFFTWSKIYINPEGLMSARIALKSGLVCSEPAE